MRHDNVSRRGGKGSAGQTRGNALWGGGKGTLPGTLTVLLLVVLALGAGRVQASDGTKVDAYLSPGLLDQAQASPDALFDVIVQGSKGKTTGDVEKATKRALDEEPATDATFKRKFASISGVSATLSGKQILKLAKKSDVESITRDSKVQLTAYANSQLWPQAAGVAPNWSSTSPAASSYPAIAVVDSGVSNVLGGLGGTFSSRLVKSVSMVTSSTSSAYYGHGSMVASIAANQNSGYTGTEPRANIVSVKVLDGNGVGTKSDVVAACDWILQNKATYNIRVANFSLNAGGDSIQFDALDKAVESLWLNGIVVVTAAGNYAVDGARSDVGFSPANDPFVLTVGASDINNTVSTADDFAAPWSAFGFTQDGFRKPEVAAPGRHMVGSVPTGATLLT